MSLRSRLIKSFLSVGVFNAVALLVGFLISVLLARSLGVEVFGKYSFIMSLVPILALPIAAGLPQLLTREIAGYIQLKQWGFLGGGIKSAYRWVGLSAAVLSLIYCIFVLLEAVPLSDYGVVLPLALILVCVNGLNAVSQGVMRGLGAPSMAVLPEMLVQPTLLLFSLVVFHALFGLDLFTVLSAHVMSALIAMISAMLVLRRLLPEEMHASEPEFKNKEWLTALLSFGLLQAFAVLNLNVGTVLVGVLSTDSEVAAMRVSEKISQLIVLPVMIVNFVVAPQIVIAWKNGNIRQIQLLARNSARATFFLALPIVLVVCFCRDFLLTFIYGDEFAIATQPLIIMAIAQMVKAFCGPLAVLLIMSDHDREALMSHIVALLVSAGFSLALIPEYGASGAASGVGVGLVVWNGLLGFYVYKKLGVRPTAV